MKKNLLLKLSTLMTLAGLFITSVAFGQATLKHSYTFEEGTYDETTVFDQAGSVDGTLGGTMISIADGKATVSGATVNSDGWISFDGVALALNTYSAVTLEAFVETGEVLNASYTMLAYFGTATPGSGCFWIQPTRAGNETRIEANNLSTTVTAFLSGYEVDDGKKHHIVAILNDEALTYYLDGIVIAEAATGADYISTLGTAVANLFRGVDGWNDPNYNASLLEFNIYDGTLDQYTIAQTAGEFLGLDLTNPNLASLSTSVGTMDPAFDPETDIYEITVPYGVTSLKLSATPVVGGVLVTMFDGLGNELENGLLTFDKDDGIDVEVEVTALDGVTKQSYFVAVFPEDGETSATLAGIDLSTGAFTSEFNMNDTAYVAIVPTGTTSVDITGIPNWDNATVTGDGTIALTDGMGSATLTVTSEDGNSTMIYTIEIHTSEFAMGTDFYLVHEANGFVATESGESFNQVVLAEAFADSATQIWQFADSGVSGQYYIMNKDGHYMCLSRTGAAYDLEVYPDLPASDLDSARFILDEFEPGRFNIISVKRKQVSANNNILGSNVPYLGSALFADKAHGDRWESAGYAVWNLKMASDKGIASPYDVHLADLTLNGASFKPIFNSAYRTYYATIPDGVTTVDVSATPRDAASTVTGTGTIDVSDGMGTITVTVAASDPSYTRDYVIHYTTVTLKHQFTFEEGTYDATTVYDQVGSVNGTIGGKKITIADGMATVSGATGNGDGWISMDGKALALKNYNSITIEVMLKAGNMENLGYTMLTYFGTATPGAGCFWIQPSRGGSTESRIETNDLNTTRTAALGGYEIDDSLKHHVVAILDRSSLKYYLDGELVSEASAAGLDFIRGLGTNVANIFRGVDGWNDPNYNGSLYEYNLYDGVMDDATILERANEFLGGLGRDATLSSLTVDVGTLLPEFDPNVTSYSVEVPVGTTTVNVSAVSNDENATVEGTGSVDVSSGSALDTIMVTAEDGFRTKLYIISFSAAGEYALMHSYTFEEGTYDETMVFDQVGNADGMLVGGTISGGAYNASVNGDHISFPADVIAINTYTSFTIETFTMDVDSTTNGSNTMLAYFGNTNPANNYGYNYFFNSLGNGGNAVAKVSCGNDSSPWTAESGVTRSGSLMDDGLPHHMVTVVTDNEIKLFIDGELAGTGTMAANNKVASIDNIYAYLCKGGYTADPTYLGQVHEYNIYSGQMDAATIAQRAKKYLGGLTLMHSYTFEDGTANDVVGTAHGILEGDAAVADGMLTLSGTGFVTLPAEEINVPSYSSISIEGVFTQAEGLDGFTAFASFGDVNPDVDWMGINYIILQPTRNDGDNSRTSISCLNTTDPWATENGVVGDEIKDTETHHWVTVITDSEIKLYIDGMLIGSDALTGNNSLANIGNSVALIGKDVYPGDPLWQGSMEELNIWQGEMDAETVAERAMQFLGGGLTLMHSYTFEDGTAKDMVGTADGILEGDASVSGGMLNLTGNGFVTLPAEEINIASYGTVTFEGVFKQADGITGSFTALASFGDVNPDVDWMGINYIILQPTRQDNDSSRTSISCLNTTDPWATENGVNGAEIADNATHHWVTVVTESEIKLYIDGVLIRTAALTGDNSLANVGNSVALIGKDVYPGDPLWQGTVEELNIYQGEMDAATIAARYNDFTTGISIGNLDDASIRVYPTYTSGDFTVETDGSRGMITVYNLLGKLVAQKLIESSRETVSVQDRGMYIMKVDCDNASKTFKVFKTE